MSENVNNLQHSHAATPAEGAAASGCASPATTGNASTVEPGNASDPKLREIRQRMYALRNGIVADALRKGGIPHKVILGLQLPQLSGIARELGRDRELGEKLWADTASREARLLACYVLPPESVTEEEAMRMASGLMSREEADILAFRLLRYIGFASALRDRLAPSPLPLERYLAEAISRFL